jgi:hypothetical protein
MQFTALELGLCLLFTAVLIVAFDFYVFSPRPSGLHQRSKKYAPLVVISISILVGLLGLATVDVVSLHGLIEAGANYGPKTQVHERSRLFLYFLVSTRSLEGLLLAMTMLASGVAMSRLHGLTGWLTSSFGIILSIGVAAVLTNPAAIHFGAAEVSLGLLSGSALLAYLAPSPTRQENWLPIGALLLTTGLLFFLSTNEFRYELALVAMASGFFFGSMLFFFRKIAGPHWESTSLYFLAGMASLVIAGFSLYLSPRGFDSKLWANEVQSERNRLSTIIATINSTGESDLVFANHVEQSRIRFQHLALKGQREASRSKNLNIEANRPDPGILEDLELIDRMLAILEKLHRARHAIIEADRRTQAALRHAADPSQTDALYDFWQNQRPWIDSELLALRYHENLRQEKAHTREVLTFIHALNSDVERLTQAALDVELHRIDVWIDWASQQPSSMLPEMKSIATEQVAHLESLSTATRSLHHKPDPRLHSLHRNLRRMASVSNHENW